MLKAIMLLVQALLGVGLATYGFLIVFNVCGIDPQKFYGLALVVLGCLYAHSLKEKLEDNKEVRDRGHQDV